MSAVQETPDQYLERHYGLLPADLDLEPGQFTVAEVERLADKYGLTKARDFTHAQAVRVMARYQVN